LRLEFHLTNIVIEILIAVEYQYRDFLQWCYALSVRDSEEPLERERLKRIVLKRINRERLEREEKERFNQITKLMVMEK